MSATSSAAPTSYPALRPTRSSAGTTTLSRLATQWTVLATACSTSTRSSHPTLIRTIGLPVPRHPTPLAVAAQLVLVRLLMTTRVSGTETLSDPILSTLSAKTRATRLHLPPHNLTPISKLAHHLIISPGDGLYDLCIGPEFFVLFAQHFSVPWINMGIYGIETRASSTV